MRILITGASGFIASNFIRELLQNPENYIIGVDNLFSGRKENINDILGKNFQFIEHDIRNPIDIESDIIYNFACPASPIYYQKDPYFTLTTSTQGAQNLANLLFKYNNTLIHMSTSEVYGDPSITPQPESYWGNVNPIGIRSPYDEGKRAAESLLSLAKNFWNLDTRIVRIFNTYGPRMRYDDGRAVPAFIHQALNNLPITVFGDGLQTRSLCYIDDFIGGLLKVSELDSLDGPLNIGNPHEITILELAEIILRLTNSKSKIIHMPCSEDDPVRRCPDISKARKIIGFEPSIELEDGLLRTIEWFRKCE